MDVEAFSSGLLSSWILSNNGVHLLSNRTGAGASALRIFTNVTRKGRTFDSFKFMEFLRSHSDMCDEVNLVLC